jgi:hypothetical protein
MQKSFLLRIITLILAFGAVGGYMAPTLIPSFYTNIPMNSLILGLLLLGIFLVILKTQSLRPEIQWLQGYRQGQLRVNNLYSPFILAPVAGLLGPVDQKKSLSPASINLALEMVYNRLQEARSSLKYITGVLIFLGLLGTFWGLLQTIRSIGDVIANLPVNTGDSILFFNDLKQGLKQPLKGMGVAFTSSMFGLGGSLIIGFLDVQVGQFYGKFYQEVEEWLISFSHGKGSHLSQGGEDAPSAAYLAGLIERLSTHLEEMTQVYAQDQIHGQNFQKNVVFLSERTATLVDYMKTEKDLMIKIAEHQLDLQNTLKHLKDSIPHMGLSDASQTHIRNLDVSVTTLIDQLHTHHAQSRTDLKEEMRFLARVLSSQPKAEPLTFGIK